MTRKSASFASRGSFGGVESVVKKSSLNWSLRGSSLMPPEELTPGMEFTLAKKLRKKAVRCTSSESGCPESKDLRGQDSAGIESRIHLQGAPKAVEKQSRSDEHGRGEGNFSDNQQAAEALASSSRGSAAALFERALQVRAHVLLSRRNPEYDSSR